MLVGLVYQLRAVLLFFNLTATTDIYTLSLHDALPISAPSVAPASFSTARVTVRPPRATSSSRRSEEHTSELQSQSNLVCRLLLEKKKCLLKGLYQEKVTGLDFENPTGDEMEALEYNPF